MNGRTMLFAVTILSALPAVFGCARFPDLGDDVDQRQAKSDFPKILPLDSLISAAIEEPEQDTSNRASALATKASALPTNALTDADRQRLSGAFAQP